MDRLNTESEPRQKEKLERPSPESFTDFRAYLRAMIRYLKATEPGFSYRSFARKAGYSSPNFLKLVADGKRNMGFESIGKFAHALGLSQREREVFETLVLLGQAKNDADRNRYYQKLRRHATSPLVQLERDQFEVYSMWYALPIRELMALPEFREDPAWIGKQLTPEVSPSEVERALELMQRIGLVGRNDEGKLEPVTLKLASTPPAQVGSLAVRNYHRKMLEHAAEALDLPVQERNITSLTVSLTPEEYELVCNRITEVRRELLDRVDDAPREDSRRVYMVGFNVFPVSAAQSPNAEDDR